MATQPREIERYVTADGQIPFDNWFDSIRVSKTQTIIGMGRIRDNPGTGVTQGDIGEETEKTSIDRENLENGEQLFDNLGGIF